MKVVTTASKQYVSTDNITSINKLNNYYYIITKAGKEFEISEATYNMLQEEKREQIIARSVDNIDADANGNVDLKAVKSVNNILPDSSGNVTLPAQTKKYIHHLRLYYNTGSTVSPYYTIKFYVTFDLITTRSTEYTQSEKSDIIQTLYDRDIKYENSSGKYITATGNITYSDLGPIVGVSAGSSTAYITMWRLNPNAWGNSPSPLSYDIGHVYVDWDVVEEL